MQRAVSASHVRHVVEPLERAGLRVDVFLATYGCGGLAPPARAARAMAHLVEWYGAARVARAEQLPRRGSSQATPSLVAMRWLRALWPPGGYRSVLLWRFDVAARREAVGLCANQPVSWDVGAKLQNSLARSNRSRFG